MLCDETVAAKKILSLVSLDVLDGIPRVAKAVASFSKHLMIAL